jgi:glyoxylase-like metal-dependent hydrolase (beta-lactamase superfamily II)
MPITLRIIPVTPFQQNCSILLCRETGDAAVVDPGGEIEKILAGAKQMGASVKKILLTHGHLDHCGAAKDLADQLGVPIEGPQIDEQFWIDQLPEQTVRFGFGNAKVFEPNRWLSDGDHVQVGKVDLEVFHCPGHTPGHIVFFDKADRLAIVGDVLFAGSIGRTDFPRGNHADLIHAIKTKLWPLGDDVQFVPGHGPMSTFGAERKTNPHVGDGA